MEYLLKGFILAVLPCLEEENNEFFETAVDILENAIKCTSQQIFYDAIWKAISSNGQYRLGALNFLLKRASKIETVEDMVVLAGHDPNTLPNALIELINDPNILVKRGCLDLMLNKLCVSPDTFSQEINEQLVLNSLNVVFKRDMSLNRRLHNWLESTFD